MRYNHPAAGRYDSGSPDDEPRGPTVRDLDGDTGSRIIADAIENFQNQFGGIAHSPAIGEHAVKLIGPLNERIRKLEEVVQWCVDHSGECIADHPKVLTKMFAALPLPKLPYDGWVVQIVRGDGNPFYWRDGILTDEIARATVYADEEQAEEVASEYAKQYAHRGQQIHIGTLSLRKAADGPSDAELS